MFNKDGEFNIQNSWQINDLLKENTNQNESQDLASKNLQKFKRSNSREKAEVTPDSLDDEIAKRIMNHLYFEGAFKSKTFHLSDFKNPLPTPFLSQNSLLLQISKKFHLSAKASLQKSKLETKLPPQRISKTSPSDPQPQNCKVLRFY